MEKLKFDQFMKYILENHKNDFAFKGLEDRENRTYMEFYNDVYSFVGYLFQKNIKNYRIAIIGENSYSWIVAAMGVLVTDNILVMLDVEKSEDMLMSEINTSNTDYLLVSKTYKEKAEQLLSKSERDKIELLHMEQYLQYDREIEIYEQEKDLDELKIIMFTSGSENISKGVMLSSKNILSNVYSLDMAIHNCYVANGLQKTETLIVLPLFHAYGLTACLLTGLYNGQCFRVSRGIRHLAEEFRKVNPYCLFLVPYVIEAYSKILVENPYGNTIKYIISGGAPLNVDVVAIYQRYGIEILNGYGMTECSPVISVNRLENNMIGSVGIPLNCCEVIIDEENDGEICVRGDNIMLGYINGNSGGVELKNGWLYTGDVGEIRSNHIWIKGRKKNIIVLSNGKKISPEYLEGMIKSIPEVNEVLVSCNNGQDIVATIVLDSVEKEVESIISEQIRLMNYKLPPYGMVSKVVYRKDSFERTSTNKIKRR